MEASAWPSIVMLCAAATLVPMGCGSDDEGTACQPGATQLCVGPGRCEGVQRCAADGSGFGECDCGAGGADAAAGSGGSGGGDAAAGSGGTGGSAATGGSGGTSGTGGASGTSGTGGSGGSGPCDPVTGGGCPSGEKCGWFIDEVAPVLTGHTGCHPIRGGNVLGQACAYAGTPETDDCAPGLVCADAKCHEVCDLTAGCAQGYRCADTNFFTDRSEAGLCIEQCDPILQDCRDPTEACYLLVGDRGDCGREGGAANCSNLGGLECARGYECVPVSDTAFECRLFCEVASPPQPRCAATETCRSFADILGSGFSETYGVCTPP